MRLPSRSPVTTGVLVVLLLVPLGLAYGMFFNRLDAYLVFGGETPHVTVTTVWTWRILFGCAVLVGLTAVVWSLVERRTGFFVTHAVLLIVIVAVSLIVFAVPNDPFQLQPRNPRDFIYCHIEGRHECP